jgi:Heparinase II/III-like protein/Heparinase II/III N-terminus
MGRLWRTVRHLSPVQLAHRVRLRARLAARRRLGEASLPATAPPLRSATVLPAAFHRPCDEDLVRETADRAADHRFSFLGVERDLGERPFPPPEDAPLLWSYHLEYMDYLLDLALTGRTEDLARLVALRFSGEPRRHLAALHPYPVSRRAAALVRVLPYLDGSARDLVARAAFAHGGWVANNLECDVGGNHLLENGLALALVGAAFEGPRALEFRRRGARILSAGALEQILPDGGHYELSPAYHCRVLAVLLEGGLALRAAGVRLPPEYWDTLARMLSFLDGILDPEGRLPLTGDSWQSESFRPQRFIRAVGRLLPVRSARAPEGDRFYRGTGLAVLEDVEAGHRLLLDGGPTCPKRLPAHGHADSLGFELHLAGRAMVVDAGLFEYAPGRMRDYCRSTRAHSTVSIDGENSSEVWSSFRIGRRARILACEFGLEAGRGTIVSSHDGYRHLGAVHGRLVSHLAPGVFLVVDRVVGRKEHRIASRLHLHPECVLIKRSGGGLAVRRAGLTMTVVPFGPVSTEVEAGWHCPDFGVRRRTQVLTLSGRGPSLVTGYLLAAGDAERAEVRVDGRRVEVLLDGRSFTRRVP